MAKVRSVEAFGSVECAIPHLGGTYLHSPEALLCRAAGEAARLASTQFCQAPYCPLAFLNTT